MATIAKSHAKFLHHEIAEDGTVGAANVQACRNVISNLNGARTAPDIPSGDRQGVYDHVAHHLRDAGVEPPPLKSEAEIREAEAQRREGDPETRRRVLDVLLG